MENQYLSRIEEALASYLPAKDCLQKDVIEAMEYSLLAGGKRIRPTLTLEFCRVCGGDVQAAMPFACAVEMIHSYSLIHDDLPCMDNSDLRRGRPANHIQYGEDIALLAGDGLLTLAFETALSPKSIKLAGAQRGAEAARLLAKAAGAEGMVGGQVIDLQHENQRAPIEVLLEMDRKKTGALIQAAAQMGCAVAGADQHLAQGINLLYFLPAALLALPAHRKNGYLDTKALPWLIGSGLICAALAAWLSAGLEVTLLRKLFGAFLIVIGLHEIFSKVRKDE